MVSVLVYGVVFSFLTCLRIQSLSSYALDLGITNQGMFATVEAGMFFYVPSLPGAATTPLFLGHFSPVYVLLLPAYGLYPSPYALVVLQSWVIALGAVPFYFLAGRLLGSDRLAFVFALVYLLHPATQGINWYDFHAESFLPLAFGASLYFYETRSWRWFYVATVFALTTIETACILAAVFALGGLASETWSVRFRREKKDRPRIIALLATLFLSVAWFLTTLTIAVSLNPQAAYWLGGLEDWAVLGASGLITIPTQVFLHPSLAAAALGFDASFKVWYLIVLFVPLQLLTLRSPPASLCCMPWLSVALLSNYRPYYLIGNQYPAYILPFLFYGAIVGLARPFPLLERLRRLIPESVRGKGTPQDFRGYSRSMIGLSLVLLLTVSPLGPWAVGSDATGGLPVLGTHEVAVLGLYSMIPSGASVLTQNNLFPLVSSRVNAFFIPTNVVFPPGTSFNRSMNTWASSVEYILADPETNFVEASLLITWPGVPGNYSVVGAADGAVLLQRGVHALEKFEPLNHSYHYQDVVPQDALLVRDAAATEGLALQHDNRSTSHFWFGPFVLLPPGNYSVTYRLKVDRPSVGTILGLPVVFHPVVIEATQVVSGGQSETFFNLVQQTTNQTFVAFHYLAGDAVPATGEYFTFSTSLEIHELGVYEFPGHAASGSVVLRFDVLTLSQQEPYSSGTIPITWSSS